MAETKTITEKLIWGTWEELLLVSAVKRHGTKNWDSVAMEIQNRLSSQSSHLILTPQNCKHKYHDLRRRFISNINDSIEEVEDDDDSDSMNPWVEELRKLRVAELKKELQQYDVSIVSLQLKVQKLTEERSSDEFEKPADLEDKGNFAAVEMEKPVSGDDSENENQSFNESNSTDPKERSRDNEPDESHKPNEATNNSGGISGEVAGDTDPVTSVSPAPAAGGEGSYNGSSETIAKDSVNPTLKLLSDLPSMKNEPGESPELWESVAESKGEGKESSDVQSSASLSKENRCRKKEVSVSSSGEEPETDEISPAINGRDGKSHPFVKVLEIIKSHKYGYVFERRLDSQETSKYKSIIRQHMDLETVNKRLKAGKYSGSRNKFFRDLLLLINNAIVFFPNNSSEFAAAIELRQLVSKEMGSRTRKTNKSSETLPRPTTTAPPPSLLAKPDPELPPSLLAKPKTTLPIIACRKRSSITKGNKASEKKETIGVEEKKTSVLDRKQDNGVVSLLDDQLVIKKGKRDRPGSGPRSSRTGKAPNNMNSSKPGPSGEDNNNNAEKTEKEKEKQSNVNTVAKKRSVANFLNRMKTPPPTSSSTSTLLDSLKNTGITPSNGKANTTDQKKGNGGRGSGSKQSLSKKNTSSPAKRSVGRPPKRNASSPVTPPPPPKRSRDTNETEAAASKQPRKRAKR